VPFSTENFAGFPSELVVERAEGEFHNDTMALASYVSDDEAFLGIKIWHVDYIISSVGSNYSEDYIYFHNLEVLVFTKKGDLELHELILQENCSEHTAVGIRFVKCYNLNLYDRNNTLVFNGVGYSNSTGFKAEGSYVIYHPPSSLLREATLVITLSYTRGPFGLYGTTKVSTSLIITVKE
jgi:hypothetical protein